MKVTPKKTWLAYILRCSDGSLYTGITNDLLRRKTVHDAGKASKYTRSRLPVKIIWTKKCKDESAARRFEIAIKKLSRLEKLNLIKTKTKPQRRHQT